MKRITFILGSAVALATAAPAGATPFMVTFIGTVEGDLFGDFLSSGKSAENDSYRESFVIDPATPGARGIISPSLNRTSGSYLSDPVLSDVLTIAGQSFSATPLAKGSFGQDIEETSYGSFNGVIDGQDAVRANGSYQYDEEQIFNQSGVPVIPSVYGGSGIYMVQPTDDANGSSIIGNSKNDPYDFLQLSPSEVIFGPVPEPAT